MCLRYFARSSGVSLSRSGCRLIVVSISYPRSIFYPTQHNRTPTVPISFPRLLNLIRADPAVFAQTPGVPISSNSWINTILTLLTRTGVYTLRM
jgi:hypothetical protein